MVALAGAAVPLAGFAAAAAVLAFSQTFATCFPPPKLAALSVGVPLAAVALAALDPRRLMLPRLTPLAPPLAALVAALLIARIRSRSPEATALLLAPPLLAAAATWTAAALATLPRDRDRLLALLATAHLGSALYGLAQATGRDPWTWSLDYGPGRIFATLGNPNFLAGQFALMLPVLAALGTAADRLPLRWLARATFAAGVPAFAAAQTRGAWLGLLAGAAMAAVAWRRQVPARRAAPAARRWPWIAIAAAPGLIPFVVPALNPAGASVPRQVWSSFEMDQQSARQRFYWWTAAGYLVRAAPVAGHGLGGFVREFPARARLALPRYSDLPPAYCDHPHSDYLWVASELGVIGLGIALWLGTAWAAAAWRGAIAGDALSLGGLAGCAALAVHAVFNMPARIEATLAAAALVAGATAARNLARPPDADPPPGGRLRLALAAIGSLTALAIAVRPATLLVAQAHLNGARVLGEQMMYGPAAFHARQTLRLTRAPWRANFMLGGALYAQRYWQEARAAFRADEAENPWGADAILHAAKTLQQEGRHGAADAEARRALTVVPNYAEASLTLARVAYARSEDAREAKRTGEQKEHLRRARTWTHYTLGFAPRHPEAWKLAGYVAIREHRWRDAVDAWRRSLANRTHDDRLRDSLAALEADLPRLLQGGRIRETKR